MFNEFHIYLLRCVVLTNHVASMIISKHEKTDRLEAKKKKEKKI